MLGAAAGELAAGRQLGNRAMLWGALAGTVPDLDVLAGTVADPVTDLAFHRCVTHSLYYAALASPVLAWMARSLYRVDARGRPGLRYPLATWLPGLLAVYALLIVGSYASPTPLKGIWAYSAVVALATAAVPLLVWALRRVRPRARNPRVSYARWLGLFALAIGTHPLLDCFTTYGTQVLQPFAELRVAWNTISVADPAYTLPFLACVLAASRALRHSVWRRRLTWLGVALSTAYLAWTVRNHVGVRAQVAADLAAQRIPHERFLVTPTLLQNVLWNVTVDQGDSLAVTQLGLLDAPFRLPPKPATPPAATPDAGAWTVLPKGDDLLGPIRSERAVRVATWFSDGYYSVRRGRGDTLQYVDLRFGLFPGQEDESAPVFGFQLYPGGPGEAWGFRQNPVRGGDVDFGEVWEKLWGRVRGREGD